MDWDTRYELITRLDKDDAFGALYSDTARVQHILKSYVHYEQLCGRFTTSIGDLRKKTCKSGPMTECFIREAALYAREDNLNGTIASLHKALLYAPTSEPANRRMKAKLYMDKANVHARQDNFEAAVSSVEAAEQTLGEENSVPIEYRLFKVMCLKRLGRWKEAGAVIDEMIEHARKGQDGDGDEFAQEDLVKMKMNLGGGGDEDSSPHSPNSKLNLTYQLDPRVTIRNSPSFGRHFIATEDIPAHTTILRERPVSIVMEVDYLTLKCSHCQHDLVHRFYPCEHCTEVTYCDAECARAAQDAYHKAECGIVGLIRGVTSPAVHVYKMVAGVGGPEAALAIQNESLDYSVEKYMEDIENIHDSGNLESNESQESKVSKLLSQYKMSSILASHDSSKYSTSMTAFNLLLAIETTALLDLQFSNFSSNISPETLHSIIVMIARDIRRIMVNVFGWHDMDKLERDPTCTKVNVANCQCLVGSLINHSCVANCTWKWDDGVIGIVTDKKIRKGKEITISYGTSKDVDYFARQLRLNHFLFSCACAICLSDATKGNNLRCRTCSNPVVYASALNKEKCLNGRCLKCFQLYDNFAETVDELKKVRDSVQNLVSLIRMKKEDSDLMLRAVDLLGQLMDLSMGQSKGIVKSVFDCIDAIQTYPLETLYSGQEQILVQFAQIIDMALPLDIPTELLNGRQIRSLGFWFYGLRKWSRINAHAQTKVEQIDISNAQIQLEYRYREALWLLIPDEHQYNPGHRLVEQELDKLEVQLE